MITFLNERLASATIILVGKCKYNNQFGSRVEIKSSVGEVLSLGSVEHSSGDVLKTGS
jgi:hypothetical protein